MNNEASANVETIHSAAPDWVEKALRRYVNHKPFILVDDGSLGIEAEDLESAWTLLKAGRAKGSITRQEVIQALAGVGITSVGIWMIAGALSDPEPTTKLGLLVLGGVVLSISGSLSALWALGVRFYVSVHSPGGYYIDVNQE